MHFSRLRFSLPALLIAAALLAAVAPPRIKAQDDGDAPTKTPIKHVVVIFQENVSFDHYFGTYPHAKPNKDGSVYFGEPKDDTPRVNGLESSGLLTANPNGVNPFRIDRSRPLTCDEDHVYGDEQYVFHGGLMDLFTSILPYTLPSPRPYSCNDTTVINGVPGVGPNSVMGYYDGNTVTALWNYAQHFAMSDNFFGGSFGPSTPGLLSLLAGNTYPATVTHGSPTGSIANGAGVGAVIGDPQPNGDTCDVAGRTWVTMGGQSVGDLLNTAHLTWGSFMGGFASCSSSHLNVGGVAVTDYIPHHAYFQYWNTTANPTHLGPSSPSLIGQTDQAKHEYDLSAFWTALNGNHLPAVSFLKAPAYQDGHAGYSDPLDEQKFLVDTINALQKSKEWKEIAVIVLYDDSDGWYDHVMGPIVQQSNVAEDRLLGSGNCGVPKALPGDGIQNGRCGYGPRMPLLVISPWAKVNYVDHRVTDQSSVLRFIEDNWNLGRIGGGSNDAIAGTLNGLFDFDDWDADHDRDHDPRRDHDDFRRDDDDGAPKLFLDDLTGTIVRK